MLLEAHEEIALLLMGHVFTIGLAQQLKIVSITEEASHIDCSIVGWRGAACL